MHLVSGAAVAQAAISSATWYNIGLGVVLVALVVAGILAYRVWSEVNEDLEPASPEELLATFDQARAEGELDEEEYNRVRRHFEKAIPRQPGPHPHGGEPPASKPSA
jgi:hypothetical protein